MLKMPTGCHLILNIFCILPILIQTKPPLSKNSYFIIKNKTNMALLETAAAYILNIITENEEVKKFPKEFVPC